MDDAELVRRVQRSGDEAAFRTLVERHRGAVYRQVLSILGPGRQGAAEELAQEVFVKAHRALGRFRGEAKFSSWLYRIAYNRAVDHRSRLRFRTPHVGEEALERRASGQGDNPLASAMRAADASVLRDCIAELPDLYRAALHLHYWMGLTVPEIGAQLEAPEGTVKSYLHRARAKLHKLLAERGVHDV